jgi:hypothetical protein
MSLSLAAVPDPPRQRLSPSATPRTEDGWRYHIDYLFVPTDWLTSMADVTVGRFEDWIATGLSDHVRLAATSSCQAPDEEHCSPRLVDQI